MRVLLVALNAKYVHTNLALRYLREGIKTEFPEVSLREFTINEPLARIAGDIYEAKADVVGFSCYIWNLSETLALIRQLRPVCPGLKIVLGGPEVSFETQALLTENPEIDAVVTGEAEESFLELLREWKKGMEPVAVAGLVWRQGTEIITNNGCQRPLELSELPFPYTTSEDFKDRIVYVETTRGCPFNCQYCLSSTFAGVRLLDPERFRREFRLLLTYGAQIIKFVDRTFNFNKKNAFRILDIVREETAQLAETQKIRIHCEMAGDLLDDEWMNYLCHYPPGLIQLEIGVQSTSKTTLSIIGRPQRFEVWQKYILRLKECNIPIHLDLIAGLPEEDWLTFRESFNDVYTVQPDMLQLGFLKLLKGSGLRQKSLQYGLVYAPDPPYTILQTNVMRHEDLLHLKRMEQLLDKYYNSGHFVNCLDATLGLFATPFDFYDRFASFWHRNDWFSYSWREKALFDKLWEFLMDYIKERSIPDKLIEALRESLRFDYYLREKPTVLPAYLPVPEEEQDDKKRLLIQNNPGWANMIPEFRTMDRRQWSRNTAVAFFPLDLCLQRAAEGNNANRKSESKVNVISNTQKGQWYLFFYRGQGRAYRYEG